MDERKKLMQMVRDLRRRISPDVLAMAHRAAMQQMGQKVPPPENEASRLLKLARENNGARRAEVLAYLERKFRNKLH
jgi:hypothetical protein